MSVHSYLRQRYGSSTQRRVREFEKGLHQKAKCSNSHIFSMQCRDEGVIPASLRIKPMVRIREGYAIMQRASRAFLWAHIHQTFRRKQMLVQQIAKLQAPLERNLGMEDYLKVTRLSHDSAGKTHVKSKQNQLSKLEALIKHKQKQSELCPEGSDRWGVNLTERNHT